MWCYALCNHLYVQSYECRRLGDRFREQLRDVARNDKDASEPVARHFNLRTYSLRHMAVSGLSLHLGSSESRTTPEQKFILQIGTLNPYAINERFSFLFSGHHIPTNSVTPFSDYKPTQPTTPPIALTKG